VLPTAAAVECFHAYSLVHDDLPAMDDDRERRGRPTVHVRFGEATAILAGDTLIPLGFELIARKQARLTPSERVLATLGLFAEALGWRGLTGGQYLDLKGVDETQWSEVHVRKTARLIEAALAAGALLGGISDGELAELRAFGRKLGRVYQLMDDLLDWEEASGKADLARFVSRGQAERLIAEQTEEALAALAPWGGRAERLRELTLYLAHRKA
jgi:farnesyl diphosphate synthase